MLLFWTCLRAFCRFVERLCSVLLVPIEWISEILINNFCGGLDDCRQCICSSALLKSVFGHFGISSWNCWVCVSVHIPFHILWFCFSLFYLISLSRGKWLKIKNITITTVLLVILGKSRSRTKHFYKHSFGVMKMVFMSVAMYATTAPKLEYGCRNYSIKECTYAI